MGKSTTFLAIICTLYHNAQIMEPKSGNYNSFLASILEFQAPNLCQIISQLNSPYLNILHQLQIHRN